MRKSSLASLGLFQQSASVVIKRNDKEDEEEEEIVGLSDDADFSRRGSDCSRLSCSYPGPGDSVDGAILSLGSEDLNARSSSSAKSCIDVSAGVDEDLYITLHLDPRLREARDALVRLAGGERECEAIHRRCLDLSRRKPELLTATATPQGDTVLMQLCSRDPQGSSSNSDSLQPQSERLLHGQILAFVRLYLSSKPDLIFARNRQGSNALVLAGLANKAAAAAYLALLASALGRRADEADDNGHTTLHVMARKGDACRDALNTLLTLKSGDRCHVTRIDVVNRGGKTPLDVAAACTRLFGRGGYERTLELFHERIQREAEELTRDSEESSCSTHNDDVKEVAFELKPLSCHQSPDRKQAKVKECGHNNLGAGENGASSKPLTFANF